MNKVYASGEMRKERITYNVKNVNQNIKSLKPLGTFQKDGKS
jgi:hypothetical protein